MEKIPKESPVSTEDETSVVVPYTRFQEKQAARGETAREVAMRFHPAKGKRTIPEVLRSLGINRPDGDEPA